MGNKSLASSMFDNWVCAWATQSVIKTSSKRRNLNVLINCMKQLKGYTTMERKRKAIHKKVYAYYTSAAFDIWINHYTCKSSIKTTIDGMFAAIERTFKRNSIKTMKK